MRDLRRAVRRALLPVALLALALTGGVAPAQAAITVSNPGTLTGSGDLQFTGPGFSFPVTISCSSESFTMSVSSSGGMTFSAATFTGCTEFTIGSVTITPSMSWSAQIRGTTGAYYVSSVPMRFSVMGCSYTGGSITSDTFNVPAIHWTHAGPLTTPSPGCNDLYATGTIALSRSLSISGSL